MNAAQMLDNVHTQVISTLDNLPEGVWDMPDISQGRSAKDIIAHLAAYEQVLLDALQTFFEKPVTPYLLRWLNHRDEFDRAEVESMNYETAQQVMDAYNDLQVQTTSLLSQLPGEKVQQHGTMPWYKGDSSLEDLVHTICEHTVKHCEHIAHFREVTAQ